MAKGRIVKALLADFETDRKGWRIAIHKQVDLINRKHSGAYSIEDKLEVLVRLHLQEPQLTKLDLDNRAQDILDALQGMIGEKGKSGKLKPVIPNDRQIYKLTLEKRKPPKANPTAKGSIEIRPYSKRARTSARSKRP